MEEKSAKENLTGETAMFDDVREALKEMIGAPCTLSDAQIAKLVTPHIVAAIENTSGTSICYATVFWEAIQEDFQLQRGL